MAQFVGGLFSHSAPVLPPSYRAVQF
jgi:hypothetical protein